MKLVAPVSLVIFFSSTMLIAQSPDQRQTQAVMQPRYSNCPLTLRARQSAGGGVLNAKDSRYEGVGQGRFLIVVNPQSVQIAAGTVVVHGPTAKGHVEQTLSSQGGSSDAAMTVAVTFSIGSDGNLSGYVWAPGLTAVSKIDLKSLTYADGSSWKLAAGETCHFILDGPMLIAGR